MPTKKESSSKVGTAGAIRERSVLDLGELSERERARALQAFEHLAPGDSLEVAVRRQPGPLFFELQNHYGRDFYWWPLERGPLVWRVTLSKPAHGAQPTVASVMGADHHRLHELWREFELAAELCLIDAVHRRLGELSLGLRRYIDIEEAVLFPLLEAQTGMDGDGAIGAMRSEHREIERVVDQLDKLHLARDCATILQTFDQPVEPMALFRSHCRKEEAVLYPFMARVFSHAEETELLSLIQAFEI
jgi:uncharacterized protein (DUF2249 family)